MAPLLLLLQLPPCRCAGRSQSVDSADTPPVFSKDSSSYNFFVSGDEGTPNDESSLFTNDPSYNFFVSDDASQRSLSEHAEEDTAQAQQEAVSSSSIRVPDLNIHGLME